MSLNHLPELIIEIKKYRNSKDWREIRVKNLGATAHNVDLELKEKRKNKIYKKIEKTHLFTIENNNSKLGFVISYDDLVKNEFTIHIEYYNRVGDFCFNRFLTLSNEPGFIPL